MAGVSLSPGASTQGEAAVVVPVWLLCCPVLAVIAPSLLQRGREGKQGHGLALFALLLTACPPAEHPGGQEADLGGQGQH